MEWRTRFESDVFFFSLDLLVALASLFRQKNESPSSLRRSACCRSATRRGSSIVLLFLLLFGIFFRFPRCVQGIRFFSRVHEREEGPFGPLAVLRERPPICVDGRAAERR